MEEKKEVQKQSLSSYSIKEYCDLLENDRYVGGGSSAPIMSAVAMSLLIKILNVVKKKNKDSSFSNDVEVQLKKFRDIYLWLADKDVEVYEYSFNCRKRLKVSNMNKRYVNVDLIEKIKELSAGPSIITLTYNKSTELEFCMGVLRGRCPDILLSDFIIAKNLIDASSFSAESTINVNLGGKMRLRTHGFKYIEDIDEQKSIIEKMIVDIENDRKVNIDAYLNTLKFIYSDIKDIDNISISRDGGNIVINMSQEFFESITELLINASSDIKGN